MKLVSIPVIAYSPVGRGWLTDQFKKLDDLSPSDFRRVHLDRFKPEVFDQNYKLVEAVEKIAERKGLKTSQVAIAWVARQGAIPIPGKYSDIRTACETYIDFVHQPF
jgi:pyridoxine 4-dehydrogenase